MCVINFEVKVFEVFCDSDDHNGFVQLSALIRNQTKPGYKIINVGQISREDLKS